VIATRGPRYGQRITLGAVPDYVPKAFLAAEDRRFYEHGAHRSLGHRPRRAGPIWRGRRVVEGGSTISQQLAKGLFLTPDQNVKRKMQEMPRWPISWSR
jgi:penicillin-binding protein 1A